jgi:hypothetical protein
VVAWTAERRAVSRTWSAERWPAARGWGELVAAQGLAGGPGGIQRIGLSAVAASCSLGPVQLHHPLGVSLQEPGQAGAVAAGAFNRPHTLTLMLVSQLEQLPVAGWGGWHRHLLDHRTGRGDDHRGGMGVLVGVDPDDELDEVCQHGHALTPCPDVDVTGRSGPDARQDCDRTRPTGIGRSGS